MAIFGQKEIKALEARTAALEAEKLALEVWMAQIETENKKLEAENATLKRNNVDLESENVNLERENIDLKGKLGKSENERKWLQMTPSERREALKQPTLDTTPIRGLQMGYDAAETDAYYVRCNDVVYRVREDGLIDPSKEASTYYQRLKMFEKSDCRFYDAAVRDPNFGRNPNSRQDAKIARKLVDSPDKEFIPLEDAKRQVAANPELFDQLPLSYYYTGAVVDVARAVVAAMEADGDYSDYELEQLRHINETIMEKGTEVLKSKEERLARASVGTDAYKKRCRKAVSEWKGKCKEWAEKPWMGEKGKGENE